MQKEALLYDNQGRPDTIGNIRNFLGLKVTGRVPDQIAVSDAQGRFAAFVGRMKEQSEPHRHLSVNVDLALGNILNIQAYNGDMCAIVYDMSSHDSRDPSDTVRPPRITIDALEAKMIFRKLSDMEFSIENKTSLDKVREAVKVEYDIETGHKTYEFKEPEEFRQMSELAEELLEKEDQNYDDIEPGDI